MQPHRCRRRPRWPERWFGSFPNLRAWSNELERGKRRREGRADAGRALEGRYRDAWRAPASPRSALFLEHEGRGAAEHDFRIDRECSATDGALERQSVVRVRQRDGTTVQRVRTADRCREAVLLVRRLVSAAESEFSAPAVVGGQRDAAIDELVFLLAVLIEYRRHCVAVHGLQRVAPRRRLWSQNRIAAARDDEHREGRQDVPPHNASMSECVALPTFSPEQRPRRRRTQNAGERARMAR